MNGQGKISAWQIFNTMSEHDLPGSFFAIRSQEEGKKPIVRALQTVAQGKFKAVDSLKFIGEYPFAKYDFQDAELPVDVTLEAYNPFIPLDSKNSAIPSAIFNITIENNSDNNQKVSILQSQQNAVGYTLSPKYDERSWNKEFIFGDTVQLAKANPVQGVSFEKYSKNYNQSQIKEDRVISLLKSKSDKNSTGYGSMAVALLGQGQFSNQVSWTKNAELHQTFLKNGQFSKLARRTLESDQGQTFNTANCIQFNLKPNEKRTITAILTWHFPNGKNGGVNPKWDGWGKGKWIGEGNAYSKHWQNATEVLDYVLQNLQKNYDLTKKFHQALYSTSLPHWAKDRLSSQLATLKSKTLFWDKNDFVGGWEGTGPGDGSCAGNCAHVWHYAQAHARLFPDIARRMTAQQFNKQKANGQIPYRLPAGHASFDGQTGHILQVYREHLLQEDSSWLKANFDKVQKSMDYTIKKWDKDRNGILSGAQHTTLDCSVSGNTSWLGSMYAAALKASAKMAQIIGKDELGKSYQDLAQKAIQSHLTELWNGQYFAQKADKKRRRDYDQGSSIDQVLGQWWATQLNFAPFYPADKTKQAMASLFTNNFKADFHGIKQVPREFVKDADAGMQVITWPQGTKRPKGHTAYADEVMSGFEYAAIASMLRAGLKEQAFIAWKAIYDRYDGRLRQGYKGAWGNWGFSGNPFGDDECGKMYSRALSHWSILLAYQGFEYDGPKAHIAFVPALDEELHQSFFTTAKSWGTFKYQVEGKNIIAQIKLDYGSLKLKTLKLKIPTSQSIKTVSLKSNGKVLSTKWHQNKQAILLSFSEEVLLKDQLTVHIEAK